MLAPKIRRDRSRREVIRATAGLGLVAPLVLGSLRQATAQDATPASPDYAGHPAVGVWTLAFSPTPYYYNVFHADGIFAGFNPTSGMDTGLSQFGGLAYGVWEPTADDVIEVSFRLAWLDAGVTDLLTFRWQLEILSGGDQMGGPFELELTDADGNVKLTDSGRATVERLRREPFQRTATPEASETT